MRTTAAHDQERSPAGNVARVDVEAPVRAHRRQRRRRRARAERPAASAPRRARRGHPPARPASRRDPASNVSFFRRSATASGRGSSGPGVLADGSARCSSPTGPIDDALLEELEELLIAADLGAAAGRRLRQPRARGGQVRAGRPAPSSCGALFRRFLDETRSARRRRRWTSITGRRDPHARRQRLGQDDDTGKLAAALQGHGQARRRSRPPTRSGPRRSSSSRRGGERVGVEVIRQAAGSDPAAVVFDAVKAATARGIDVLIVDTAGRLHTKTNLMDELVKLKRVIERQLPGRAPRVADGARRAHGPERVRAGAHVPRGDRPHRPRPDQARRHRQGRHRRAHRRELGAARSSSSASASRSTTSSPSTRSRFVDALVRLTHDAAMTVDDAASCGARSSWPSAGRGLTSPNPMVGAVVVRDGRMVGRGLPPRARGPARRGRGAGRAPARARAAPRST